MIHSLLALTLFLTPIGPLFEPIEVHGSLTLNAKYIAKGSKVTEDRMAFSIGDFALLQSELEVVNEAWNVRISSLISDHERRFAEMTAVYQEQMQSLKLSLSDKDVSIAQAESRATEAESLSRTYKLSLIITAVVASGAIVYLAAGD